MTLYHIIMENSVNANDNDEPNFEVGQEFHQHLSSQEIKNQIEDCYEE